MKTTTPEKPQHFLFANKNQLIKLKPVSNLKSLVLGLLVLCTQNPISAFNYSRTLNSTSKVAVFAACPSVPTATSPQIICQGSTVGTLKASVDAGATLLWYADATGGTPLSSSTILTPGNYYAAATDGSCESDRKLVVVATNNALYLDGNNDFVTLAKNPFVHRQKIFTIEAWIKPDDFNYNNGFHAIFGSVNQYGGDSDRGPSLYMYNINGVVGGLHFDSYNGITKARYQFKTAPTTTPLMEKNAWNHVAIVNDGTNYTLYVNGKLVALDNNGATVYSAPAPPQGVNIISTNIYTLGRIDNNFAGLLDEVRFWNVARSASDIAATMNVSLTGTETGLVSYYTFNQGIANGTNAAITTLYDTSATQNSGTFHNLALTGTTSNFVEGYFAPILNQSSSSTTIVMGTIQLSHTSKDGAWISSDDTIATVDPVTGLVTGVSGGTAVITYSLCGSSTTYTVTVLPNPAPTISQIANASTCPGTSLPPLAFKVADDSTPATSLLLTATSSNTALIPDSNIVLGGTGANRTITLSTVAGQSGTATITITATDENNASSTMNFVVSYYDITPPTVVTKRLTVALDASGVAIITADQIDNGSTDNCGLKGLFLTPSSFTCANVGFNTVTLTVTDASGNTATGTATVIVVDVTPPTVITKDITVTLDASGNATITADQINDGSSDSCGILKLAVSTTLFTTANLGDNTVILTASDARGNIATGTAKVFVASPARPAIRLEVYGSYADSSLPAGLSVGDTINYGFMITNTGNVPLTPVVVMDELHTVLWEDLLHHFQ